MPNRLAGESSPYLLQHAHNPVDWYPWGEEAFARARELDRPILLSIGYSSCHWCHVMERESFEDVGVAKIMNEAFVSVKVDREERPDVDQVYMRAVHALTGQGGWPLTVFLTPSGEPYYGGTYLPPVAHQGMPSFRQVLEAAARAWRDRRDDVRKGASELLAALREAHESAPDGQGTAHPGEGLLDRAVRAMAGQYDPTHGGFGRAPKFPQPVTLEVLLRQHARTGAAEPLDMALHTLRRMAAGGIRDHLGGGFHRYSVDARWLVPHFEKMLYDNALLARVYLDAYRITGAQDLLEVAEQTLGYLLADMRDPRGGFYSARDADSEGEEGRYYVWTPGQVLASLSDEEAGPLMRCYDVTPGGNFEGRNILWLPHDLDAVARAESMDPDALRRLLAGARATLLELRSDREPPLRDEKVLVGWNGMALRAFAEAGGALGRDDWMEAAATGADFILTEVRRDGALLHTWKDGTAKIPAFLEDHAALGNALLSLHEATLDRRWLGEARWCCEQTLARFWDEKAGVFHDSAEEAGAELFMRARDPMDNATPSGNSLAAELLLRSGHLFAEERYREVAERVMAREATTMGRFPTAFGRLLCAVDRASAEPAEVAIVGPRGAEGTRALTRTALAPFHRNRTVVGHVPGEADDGIPLLEGRGTIGGKPTAYLCHGYACDAPVTDPAALAMGMAEAARGAALRRHPR
jgi:uncharacterized protein YyaL (SSP411 family)